MNSYNYYITDYPQYFHNAEHDINCILGFFQDASFAGNLQESRSNLCAFRSSDMKTHFMVLQETHRSFFTTVQKHTACLLMSD